MYYVYGMMTRHLIILLVDSLWKSPKAWLTHRPHAFTQGRVPGIIAVTFSFICQMIVVGMDKLPQMMWTIRQTSPEIIARNNIKIRGRNNEPNVFFG